MENYTAAGIINDNAQKNAPDKLGFHFYCICDRSQDGHFD